MDLLDRKEESEKKESGRGEHGRGWSSSLPSKGKDQGDPDDHAAEDGG